MKKTTYRPKPLFYILFVTVILSLVFGPIGFSLVVGFWFLYAMVNFANRVSKDSKL